MAIKNEKIKVGLIVTMSEEVWPDDFVALIESFGWLWLWTSAHVVVTWMYSLRTGLRQTGLLYKCSTSREGALPPKGVALFR